MRHASARSGASGVCGALGLDLSPVGIDIIHSRKELIGLKPDAARVDVDLETDPAGCPAVNPRYRCTKAVSGR